MASRASTIDTDGDGTVSIEEAWAHTQSGNSYKGPAEAVPGAHVRKRKQVRAYALAKSALSVTSGFARQQNSSCVLHVRGVGGSFESEVALVAVFTDFCGVANAVVRHRTGEDGANTSWGLVTMETQAGVVAALAGASALPKPLTIKRFDSRAWRRRATARWATSGATIPRRTKWT